MTDNTSWFAERTEPSPSADVRGGMWSERFRGAMLGGAVGDALGAGVRHRSSFEIQRWFGPKGVVDYLPVFGRRGAATELTQLTVFTLEALLRAKAVNPDPAGWLPSPVVATNQLRWLYTQGVPWEFAMSAHLQTHPEPSGWLLECAELFSTRNPSGVALRGMGQLANNPPLGANAAQRPALGKESFADSVVWAAPTMVWNSSEDLVFATGAAISNLLTSDANVHGASGLHSDVLAQLIRGVRLWDAVSASESQRLGKAYGHEDQLPADVRRAVQAAMFASHSGRPAPAELDVAFDTDGKPGELGIALAAAACSDNFADAVWMAVNQSADSSVTGALAGQLAGAIHGPTAIPTHWLDDLELREVIELLCDDATEAFAPPPLPKWAQRYVDTKRHFSGPLELTHVEPVATTTVDSAAVALEPVEAHWEERPAQDGPSFRDDQWSQDSPRGQEDRWSQGDHWFAESPRRQDGLRHQENPRHQDSSLRQDGEWPEPATETTLILPITDSEPETQQQEWERQPRAAWETPVTTAQEPAAPAYPAPSADSFSEPVMDSSGQPRPEPFSESLIETTAESIVDTEMDPGTQPIRRSETERLPEPVLGNEFPDELAPTPAAPTPANSEPGPLDPAGTELSPPELSRPELSDPTSGDTEPALSELASPEQGDIELASPEQGNIGQGDIGQGGAEQEPPPQPKQAVGGHAKVEGMEAGGSEFVAPSLTDRVLGCLLGGALGNALGSDLEFANSAEISAKFGPDGPHGLPTAYGVRGAIADDTQLTLFTAEGLIRGSIAQWRYGADDPLREVQLAYQRWLHTQGMPWESAAGSFLEEYRAPDGWLIEIPELFAVREPGKTVFGALAGFGEGNPAGSFSHILNDSKGCGAVMRAAPVALYSDDPSEVFTLAARIAALTHSHPSAFHAAGAFAVIVQQALLGHGLDDGVWLALQVLETWDEHEETSAMLKLAVDLASRGTPVPQQIEQNLGGGWVGEQALAIAVCAALAGGDDIELALRVAVHHSGDSDSTGSICGNIIGALSGAGGLPSGWLDDVELRNVIEQVGLDCVAEFGVPGQAIEAARPDDADWNRRYPVRLPRSVPNDSSTHRLPALSETSVPEPPEVPAAFSEAPSDGPDLAVPVGLSPVAEFPSPKPSPRRINGVMPVDHEG